MNELNERAMYYRTNIEILNKLLHRAHFLNEESKEIMEKQKQEYLEELQKIIPQLK